MVITETDRDRFRTVAVELSHASERIQRALRTDDPEMIVDAVSLTKAALNRLTRPR